MLGFAVALAVLACASYSDLKTREVSDLVWIFGYPLGSALTLIEVSAGRLAITPFLVSTCLSAVAAALLFRFGLFGGADALALTFLGLAVPAYPEGLPLLGDAFMPPAFVALGNAVILSLACPIAVFTLNALDLLRGRNPFRGVEADFWELIALMFTARRVSLERLTRGLHYFPAERLVERGGRLVRVPVCFMRAEGDFSAVTKSMVEHGEIYADGALASPTLPMIAFLTMGLALALVGNLALQLVRLLTGF